MTSDMLTEDEASLYDRQIRLWGLEAQNRMRSSTIVILTLRSLAQETIKNLVLAGVGRLIVMDDQEVTEDDFGAGLLFREGDGDLGKKRVDAALPQITSLNPLVKVTPISSLQPFTSSDSAAMEEFLKREKVDLVCGTDLSRAAMIEIDAACRNTGTAFYGAGSYGFLGYIINDLGKSYEYIPHANAAAGPSKTSKRRVDYPSIKDALATPPYKGKTHNQTKQLLPANAIGVQAVWEYEAQHGALPDSEEAASELSSTADELRKAQAINEKTLPTAPTDLLQQLATTAKAEFTPTAAILGGLLAQDILRTLSRKDKPIINFLTVDTMEGSGAVSAWGVGKEEDC